MKIVDVDAAGLSAWAFAQIDGVVTIIILALFGFAAMMRSHIRVLLMLLCLVIVGSLALSFMAFNYTALHLPVVTWLFLQSLAVYVVFLSFQTLFFERFIACFRVKGNVGFFIVTLDFVGYVGTVLVLVMKEWFTPDVVWLDFYNNLSAFVGIFCAVAFFGSAVYILWRYHKENGRRTNNIHIFRWGRVAEGQPSLGLAPDVVTDR